MQVTTIHLDQVQPHPHNIRRDVGDVTELADSLKSSGILQPIVVAPSVSKKKTPTYTLIAGHRRFAAAKECGWKDIDAIVRDDLDTEAKQIETMAIENLQRTNLTPVEEAHAYQELLDLGYTPQKIAKSTGRNVKTVKLRIGLNKLSHKASEKLHTGQITIEQAEVLASFAKNPKAYAELEKSIGTSNFAWQVQNIKAKQTKDAERQKLADQLKNDGVALIKRPDQFPWSSTEKPLSISEWRAYGLDIDPAEHTSCPGHAAIIIDDYRGVRIEYVCTDPNANGHMSAAEPDEVDERAAELAQRSRESNEAATRRMEDLRTAELTRHEFVKTLLTRKLSSAAVMAALRAAAASLLQEVVEYSEPGVLLDVLVIDAELDESDRIDRAEQMVVSATDVTGLARLLLAFVFTLNDPGIHSFGERTRRGVLDMLVAAGYELSDVERAELDRFRPVDGVCKVCGCTEDEACEGGCAWMDATQTLCSACAEKAERDVEDVVPAGDLVGAL